jgi:hypothetical protein
MIQEPDIAEALDRFLRGEDIAIVAADSGLTWKEVEELLRHYILEMQREPDLGTFMKGNIPDWQTRPNPRRKDAEAEVRIIGGAVERIRELAAELKSGFSTYIDSQWQHHGWRSTDEEDAIKRFDVAWFDLQKLCNLGIPSLPQSANAGEPQPAKDPGEENQQQPKCPGPGKCDKFGTEHVHVWR